MDNLRILSCAVSLMAALFVSDPAAADGDLFAAMAKLVSEVPASQPPSGEWKSGSLVDQWQSGSGVVSHVMSPGGDPCVLVHLWTEQRKDDWAMVATKTYDFRKLVAARFLADADDRATAASRAQDDPAVTEMLLEGANWSIHRIVHLGPEKPTFEHISEDNWSIFLLSPEDRSAAAEALDIVRSHCFAKP